MSSYIPLVLLLEILHELLHIWSSDISKYIWNSSWVSPYICPFTSPDLYKILHGYLYLSICSWLSRYLHVSRLCPCIHGHLQVFMKLIIHGYLAVFIKFFHGISISNVVSIKISIAISIYVTIRISINIPHVWVRVSISPALYKINFLQLSSSLINFFVCIRVSLEITILSLSIIPVRDQSPRVIP